MPTQFSPVLLKMYTFKKHTVLMIASGLGMFQVDFKNYTFSSGKSLFLAPGQYFQLLSGEFKMLKYQFEENDVRHIENTRLLFSHLVSIGHIEHGESQQIFSSQLSNIDICETNSGLLSHAIQDWLILNPFKTTVDDLNLLFDLKEIIDEKYTEPISIDAVAKQLGEKPHYINRLTKEKLDNTLNKLAADKILLETKRKIVFTDLTTKEIAYSTGFRDPDYFNRFFKKHTNLTPLEFRKRYDFDERDTFIIELMNLIDIHFKEEHFAEFYADKLSITLKTLLNRISERMATSFTHLISAKLLQESKLQLQQGMPVKEVAFNLGFKEPNHLTVFFKRLTSKTPTQFLSDL